MTALILAADDPAVTGASLWPIRSVWSDVPDNAVFTGTLDHVPFWSDGFYMERGAPPPGTTPHPRQNKPFALTLLSHTAGGMYVPVEIGPYVLEEPESYGCAEDEEEEGEDQPEPEPVVAGIMVHAKTRAPIVAIQAKYLNRIRTAAADPTYSGAHSFGREHWPLVVFDSGKTFAVVMEIRLNYGDLAGCLAGAERAVY